MADPDQQVAQGQHHRPVETAWTVSEGLGNGEGQHEHGRHGDEDGQLELRLVRALHIGQPRVPGPGPPQQGDDQDSPQQAMPVELVGHERGDLGQREDEHQIEEKLQRVDRGLLQVRPDPAAGCLHPHIVNM